MSSRTRRNRGFTLIEVVVVVAIIAILAVLAGSNISRHRPRATLAGTTAELQALIHGARQAALASGHDVIVMLFPVRTDNPARVVVVQDPTFTFMTGGGDIDFDEYDPEVPAYPAGGSVEIMDLPGEIEVGPAAGMGGTLAEPLAAVDVAKACSFCSTDDAKNRRGAIRFDPRGAATFYSEDATKRSSGVGASFTITNPLLTERDTFVILSSTGAVQVERRE